MQELGSPLELLLAFEDWAVNEATDGIGGASLRTDYRLYYAGFGLAVVAFIIAAIIFSSYLI